jgi:hypothetical protein
MRPGGTILLEVRDEQVSIERRHPGPASMLLNSAQPDGGSEERKLALNQDPIVSKA